MRKLGKYLLANNTRAAIAAFLCALLPLIALPGGLVAAVIVGLVTLRKGYKDGLFILAFVALPAISLLVLRQFGYGVFDVLLARCILVWAFASLLRRTSSWIIVLQVMVAVGVIAIVVVHLFIPDIKHVWVHLLQSFYKAYAWANVLHTPPERTQEFIKYVAPFASGILAFLLFFVLFIEVLLARWWQTVIFDAGKLRAEFNRIHVSRLVALILIIASIGLYWQPAWLIDIYPLLLLPFVVGGLSLLHSFATVRKELFFLLVATYIVLALLTFIVVVLLALLGFVDSWVDFRKRRQLPS